MAPRSLTETPTTLASPPVLLRSLLVGVVVGGLVLLAYHPD